MLAKEVNNKERLMAAADAIENLEASTKEIPAGYLRMELSTMGRMGAPSVFHVRNFDTREIVELSITATSELPIKLSSILDSLIYEDDFTVADFHENEVVELLVKIFAIFYEHNIDVDFPWNEEDIKYLQEEGKVDLIESLQTGTWKPKANLNLAKLKFYNPENKKIKLKKVVDLTSKKTGFNVRFSYPRYGDAIVVKKYLETSFKAKDPDIQDILKRLEVRKRLYDDAEKNGTEVNTHMLPFVSKEEIDRYTAYETDKALFAVDLVRALHLEGFDGKDLSNASLKEKIEYITDPRINHNITRVIEKEFEEMLFGIDPNIKVTNPITKKPCTRRFLFRIMDILQAIREYETDEYDVRYE